MSRIARQLGLHRLVVFATLVAIILASVGAKPAELPQYEGWFEAAPAATCSVTCLTARCDEVDLGWHKALSGGALDELDHGSHDECWEESCGWYSDTGYHDQCGGSLALARNGDYLRLTRAIDAKDGTRVRQLIARYPRVLVVNEARGSVQVAGCDGSVLANHPLPTSVMNEVLAH